MVIQLTELARAVAERTGLSREESADITRAVVEGLAGQVSKGEADHLAVELPLAAELAARPGHRTEAHPVRVLDFIRQVGARTGLPERDARAGTGAVLAVLRETLSEDAYSHLMGQLPAEYSELAAAVG